MTFLEIADYIMMKSSSNSSVNKLTEAYKRFITNPTHCLLQGISYRELASDGTSRDFNVWVLFFIFLPPVPRFIFSSVSLTRSLPFLTHLVSHGSTAEQTMVMQ